MDAILKLLRKAPQKDALRIRAVISQLIAKNFSGLDIKKLVGTDYYRARVNKYRIIFRYDDSGDIQIDSVNHRDDTTYNNI